MKRKILFSIIIFLAAVAAGSIFVLKAGASSSQNASGWLWGGSNDGNTTGAGIMTTGLGWISMNSTDCDSDGNGFIDVACGGDNMSVPVISYGVNIPPNDGDEVTGYAWSSNLGWIDFEPQNNCGVAYSAGSCNLPVGASGNPGVFRIGATLEGWARIVSIAEASAVGNAGGWEGWIKIHSSDPGEPAYGVTVGTGTLSGKIWSNELGYIDFLNAKINCTSAGSVTYSVVPAHCTGAIACGGKAYWQCNKHDNCGDEIVPDRNIPECASLSGVDITCNAQCSTGWIETNPQ